MRGRPTRGWAGPYRFTGKEEDREVGLVYFGKRFLNAQLGRWMSADPLAVHVPGRADANLYAYVSGAVLQAVDPVGLEDSWWDSAVSAVKSAGAAVVEKGKEAVEAGKAVVQNAIDTGKEVVRQVAANPGEFAAGVAEGAFMSVVPAAPALQLAEQVANPHAPQPSVARQLGRGIAEVVVGVKEIAAGAAVTTGSVGGGLVAAGPTGGASLVVGAAGVGAGAVLLAQGTTAAANGLLEIKTAVVRCAPNQPPARATPEPAKAPAAQPGAPHTPEQEALVEMAKADKRAGGVTAGDMEAYKQLNAEAGSKGFTQPNAVRGPEAHPPRTPQSTPGPGQEPHGHVGPVDHIPVKEP